MKPQFRIGNCNFSLTSSRWKKVRFLQKKLQAQFGCNKIIPSDMPTARLHQCSKLLGDHIYMFGGMMKQRKNGQERKQKLFSAINLKSHRWHSIKISDIPQDRDSHKMTVLKHELYLFGGSDDKKYFNDLCSFNTFSNQWRGVVNNGDVTPCGRDPMIFEGIGNEYLLLIGGTCFANQTGSQYLQDSYIFKDNSWVQYQMINYPNGLISAESVCVGNRVFVFGGFNRHSEKYSQVLFELVIDQSLRTVSWNQIKLSIDVCPSGRMNHSLVGINSQYFVLLGGSRLDNSIFRDIWVFDSISVSWRLISPNNGPLMGLYSMSAVLYNNTVYLLGGMNQAKEINSQVIAVQFANQQIFRSQVCENCINVMQKKQNQNKKYPKNLTLSTGFLYNIAMEIKFPFHAIMMIYSASALLKPTYFRISIEKTLNAFNFIKIQFDNTLSLNTQSFNQFITHHFTTTQSVSNHQKQSILKDNEISNLKPTKQPIDMTLKQPYKMTLKQIKQFTQNLKLGALRLGKTFLLITTNQTHRYVYLLSAESKISPHFDESYIYYCYVENLSLQRIQSEEGIKQRQFILNILKSHIPLDAELILQTKTKTVLLIFEPKVAMIQDKNYYYELQSSEQDIKIWKNEKKVSFLQERGYSIQEDVQISLNKWIMLYHLNKQEAQQINFFINQTDLPVPYVSYTDFLNKLATKSIIHKVPLPQNTGFDITGQIYVTHHPSFLQSNYGLLIYLNSKLHSRYPTQFGHLFPQHFYKAKYKRAKTLFNELGVINITTPITNSLNQLFNQSDQFANLMQKIQSKCNQIKQQLQNSKIQHQNSQQDQEQPSKKIKI